MISAGVLIILHNPALEQITATKRLTGTPT
jgi:hypothetical protein